MIVKIGRPGDMTDITDWVDGESLHPGDDELANFIKTIEFLVVDDDGTLPRQPAKGLEVELYDETPELTFSGRIAIARLAPITGVKRWEIEVVSWGTRLLETATGSLNKTGVVDVDRNFVIAILRDGLKNQTFGAVTAIDDPIVTANEPNWPLVQGTAVISGKDWSYQATHQPLEDILAVVPNVILRVRPDLLVEYGIPDEECPIALTTSPTPDAALLAEVETYTEDEIVGAHRNKLRLGGAGAAEETATDEVSMAVFDRILDAPYENDENIPASDLKRLAYAKLHALRVRRVAGGTVISEELRAGQVVQVYNGELGAFEPDGPFLDVFFSIPVRSKFDGVDADYRGEMLVQKVSGALIGTGPEQLVEFELGDRVLEFETALAVGIGGNA